MAFPVTLNAEEAHLNVEEASEENGQKLTRGAAAVVVFVSILFATLPATALEACFAARLPPQVSAQALYQSAMPMSQLRGLTVLEYRVEEGSHSLGKITSTATVDQKSPSLSRYDPSEEEAWGSESAARNEMPSLAFLFGGDGMETTSSGRELPSKYVSSVREVVLRLRESLEEDDADRASKFREKAEAAKDAIRNYLQQWRGKGIAQDVDSAIENALRELSTFYSKNGPRALVTAEVRQSILEQLRAAEASL